MRRVLITGIAGATDMPWAPGLKALERRMLSPAIALVSVDVYDTILLRRCRPELLRFHDIARQQHHALTAEGVDSPGAERLYRARLIAHKQAYDRARACGGEPRLYHILEAVASLAGLPADAVPLLAQAEAHYEADAVRPHRGIVRLLERVRGHKPVVLTSDMYLPAETLRRILAKATPELADLTLFVSAEIGATKRDGTLFQHVARATGIAPGGILHVGDHPHSDVKRAREAGLAALWLPRPWWWRITLRLRDRLLRRRLARRGWLAGAAPLTTTTI